jgi:hypothetical protein
MRLSAIPLTFVLALMIGTVGVVHADTYSAAAVNNGTIQPTGPRMGPNGMDFFNMEGPTNMAFASYGAADFNSGDLGINFPVGSIASVTVSLTQANAAFTHNGNINFYITEDTTTDISADGMSPLVYDATDDPEGLSQQLTPRHLLGSGTFTQTMDGDVDMFSFTPDDATVAYLINQIANSDVIRIVISPADETVAATYAGFSNVNFTGPVITLDAAP